MSASQITSVSIVYSTVCSGTYKKKTSKLRLTGLCEGNSPVTGGFHAQRASNADMFPFDDVIMQSARKGIMDVVVGAICIYANEVL